MADDSGNHARFAERCGISAGYLSQLLNAHGPFGEKIARKLESRLGLERNSLDQIDMRPRESDGIDAEVLQTIMVSVRTALDAAGETWDRKSEARLVADLYKIYVKTGEYPNAGQAVMLAGLRSGGG